jgi:glyoxylase I family protein
MDHQWLPVYATLRLGPLYLLLTGPSATGSRPVRDGRVQGPGGWNRVVLRVDNLPSWIDRLKKSGVQFRNAMETGPGGRQIQLEDPDGNSVELFEAASV